MAEIRQHWCHYAHQEPDDTRPLTDPRWPAFVRWVATEPGIRKDLAERDGFAANGLVVWLAFRAGSK